MSELKLIKAFRVNPPTHPWITVGPGQDCAILSWPGDRDQAYKIDQVVEGTHFVLSGESAATPYQVGWKAMAKACSDIAATGFWPVAATVAVNLRKGSDEALAMGIYEGLTACCRRFNFGLAGGDLATSENGLSVVVSLLGEGPKGGAWLRNGAKPGDVLLATGRFGGSLKSGEHLTFTPRLEQARDIRQIAGLGVHACIDVTDGLSRDLHHMCDESQCGAVIEEEKLRAISNNPAIENALCDGEDFELLLACEAASARKLLHVWSDKLQLTEIGSIQAASAGCVLRNKDGRCYTLPECGFEHQLAH